MAPADPLVLPPGRPFFLIADLLADSPYLRHLVTVSDKQDPDRDKMAEVWRIREEIREEEDEGAGGKTRGCWRMLWAGFPTGRLVKQYTLPLGSTRGLRERDCGVHRAGVRHRRTVLAEHSAQTLVLQPSNSISGGLPSKAGPKETPRGPGRWSRWSR